MLRCARNYFAVQHDFFGLVVFQQVTFFGLLAPLRIQPIYGSARPA